MYKLREREDEIRCVGSSSCLIERREVESHEERGEKRGTADACFDSYDEAGCEVFIHKCKLQWTSILCRKLAISRKVKLRTRKRMLPATNRAASYMKSEPLKFY